MLKQRVLTAIVLLAIFLTTLFIAPPIGFQLLILVVFTIGAWECSNLAGISSLYVRVIYTVCVCGAVFAGWRYLPESGLLQSFFVGVAIWWAIALLWVQGYPSSSIFWQARPARMVVGLLMLVPAGVAVLTIHSLNEGKWLVLALLVLVATADSGAYFTGKAFGKTRLAPNVSPGKSWEGVIGGLVLVAIIALIYGVVSEKSWYVVLLIAIPAAAVSVLGDLLESMLKRHRGIKDSGSILPGHGGILDRIDGVTAAAPVFALALIVSGWGL